MKPKKNAAETPMPLLLSQYEGIASCTATDRTVNASDIVSIERLGDHPLGDGPERVSVPISRIILRTGFTFAAVGSVAVLTELWRAVLGLSAEESRIALAERIYLARMGDKSATDEEEAAYAFHAADCFLDRAAKERTG